MRRITDHCLIKVSDLYQNPALRVGEANLINTSSSTARKGLQDYNKKFLEFAHTSTNAAFDFLQRLNDAKSPSEFMELSTEHARAQTQTLTEQTKALAELSQKIALAGAKALQVGVAKCLTALPDLSCQKRSIVRSPGFGAGFIVSATSLGESRTCRTHVLDPHFDRASPKL